MATKTTSGLQTASEIINTAAFLCLTITNQQKVLIIYQLAIIYKEMKKGKLTPTSFDTLYDTDIDILEQYLIHCQDALLHQRNISNKIEWE